MAFLGGRNGGASAPTEQGLVVAQVAPDYLGICAQQYTDDNRRSFFNMPKVSRANDRLFSIRQHDIVFAVRTHMAGNSKRKLNSAITKHTYVRTTLNGLVLPPEPDDLVNRLMALNAHPRIIQGVYRRYIDFLGVSKSGVDHDSSQGGNKRDPLFAILMSGVAPVRVHKCPLALGQRVRFNVPVSHQYTNASWWGTYRKDIDVGKIQGFMEPVDPYDDWQLMASTMAAFFAGGSDINAICRGVTDSQKAMIPMVALPEHFRRLFATAGIQMIYYLMAAGMLQPTPPSEANGNFQSQQTAFANEREASAAIRANGFSALNFSDAFRYVESGAGGRQYPEAGNTNAAQVRTFGSRAGRANSIGTQEAAMEYAIHLAQLFGLTMSCAPPTSSSSGPAGSLANEGFFRRVSSSPATAAAKLRAEILLDTVCRSTATKSYRDNQYAQTFFGYNPRTRSNPFVMSGTSVISADTSRDAGRVGEALADALPNTLMAISGANADMNPQGDGIVIESGSVGKWASVYIRKG